FQMLRFDNACRQKLSCFSQGKKMPFRCYMTNPKLASPYLFAYTHLVRALLTKYFRKFFTLLLSQCQGKPQITSQMARTTMSRKQCQAWTRRGSERGANRCEYPLRGTVSRGSPQG